MAIKTITTTKYLITCGVSDCISPKKQEFDSLDEARSAGWTFYKNQSEFCRCPSCMESAIKSGEYAKESVSCAYCKDGKVSFAGRKRNCRTCNGSGRMDRQMRDAIDLKRSQERANVLEPAQSLMSAVWGKG